MALSSTREPNCLWALSYLCLQAVSYSSPRRATILWQRLGLRKRKCLQHNSVCHLTVGVWRKKNAYEPLVRSHPNRLARAGPETRVAQVKLKMCQRFGISWTVLTGVSYSLTLTLCSME